MINPTLFDGVSDLYPRGEDGEERHIVDILIEERAEHLIRHPLLWAIIKRALYPLLKYKAAVDMADQIADMPGLDALDWLKSTLNLQVQVRGIEHIPQSGRIMVVANHPTGIADGIAVYQALSQVRPDIAFFANSDALRVSPRFIEALIPVEWVDEKRTVAKTKLMLKRASSAFSSEQAVVMFPSGRLAELGLVGVKERPWFSSTITMARKYKTPILPLHIDARNSGLYYLFASLSGQLRDITLFNEMLNKSGRPFGMSFGAPVESVDLADDPTEATQQLKSYVTEMLPDGETWPPA